MHLRGHVNGTLKHVTSFLKPYLCLEMTLATFNTNICMIHNIFWDNLLHDTDHKTCKTNHSQSPAFTLCRSALWDSVRHIGLLYDSHPIMYPIILWCNTTYQIEACRTQYSHLPNKYNLVLKFSQDLGFICIIWCSGHVLRWTASVWITLRWVLLRDGMMCSGRSILPSVEQGKTCPDMIHTKPSINLQ